MKRWVFTVAAALSAAGVFSQEYGAKASDAAAPEANAAVEALPPPVGEGEAVAETQQIMEDETPPAPTAIKAIRDYLKRKKLTSGYDEEKGRILTMGDVTFTIKKPEVDASFLKLRQRKMDELFLTTKAELIEGISSQMSAERWLETPGTAVQMRLASSQEAVQKKLDATKRQIEKMDVELAEAAKDRDSLTSRELVAVISSWFAKADKQNLAKKYDEEKKGDYQKLKQGFEAVKKEYDALVEKAEAIRAEVVQKQGKGLARFAQMPIHGCTILKQAESITLRKDGKYDYQIAILMSWSDEMQKASDKILHGDSIRFKPGKRTVQEWIDRKAQSGELAQTAGGRNYIDDKGKMWFLGIAAAPITGRSYDDKIAGRVAGLMAAAEVIYGMYADAYSTQKYGELTEIRKDAEGDEVISNDESDYAQKIRENFKNIQLSGNFKLYNDVIRHKPSGLDIQVVVYGVNSGSTRALANIKAQSIALGIDINTYQQMQMGRDRQLRASFEASKDNAEARAAGAAQANEELRAAAAKRMAERRAAAEKQRRKATAAQKNIKPSDPASKGKVQAGVYMFDDDDDDE